MNSEITQVIAALSARVSALEAAIFAIAAQDSFNHDQATTAFDAFVAQLSDRYVAWPVEDSTLDALRQSIEDVRELLAPRG